MSYKSYNWPQTKQFLKDVEEIIDAQVSISSNNAEYLKGYADGLEDLMYACSLSTIALEQHFQHHEGAVSVCQYDYGYDNALEIVMDEISKILVSEEWSIDK